MIGIISHPECLLHDMQHAIPEIPKRLQVIADELIHSGFDAKVKYYDAPYVTREQLKRVHGTDYIETIFKHAPNEGMLCLDPDTYMNSFSLKAALRAAGSGTLGVDLVMKKEIPAAFCNVRPPGHHAEKNRAMGFCIFNNIAVAVAHALTVHQLKNVAIIDFDVHHGNGTEDIFKDNEQVLFCSSFEYPFYPFSGADTKSKHIINVPLPEGTTGMEFRERVADAWFQRIEQFKPEMIFISAGFDAYYKDDMSDLLLYEEDYAWITQQIAQIAHKVCDGRIVSFLEGGYALDGLGRCVVAHLRELEC